MLIVCQIRFVSIWLILIKFWHVKADFILDIMLWYQGYPCCNYLSECPWNERSSIWQWRCHRLVHDPCAQTVWKQWPTRGPPIRESFLPDSSVIWAVTRRHIPFMLLHNTYPVNSFVISKFYSNWKHFNVRNFNYNSTNRALSPCSNTIFDFQEGSGLQAYSTIMTQPIAMKFFVLPL